MRVLRVIARLNVGGPAIQAITLTERLREHGYDSLLLRGQEGANEGNMDHLAERRDVKPFRVPGLRREIGPHDLRALGAMVRVLVRFAPDVLHTHTAKAGMLGRLAAVIVPWRRPAVIVHTFHGHVLRDAYFSRRTSAAFARLERWLARRSTRLIAVSDEVKDDLVDLGVAPAEKIEVIRLGFDLSPFAEPEQAERAAARARVRERHGIAPTAPMVLAVARLVPVKRIDRMLAAMRELPGDVHLLVCGDGELRKSLMGSPDAQELGERVRWAGFRQELAEYYFAADAVVLTSDSEGTPVCLIEAQAAGVPVVSTRVGGVNTVILEGASGYVVDTTPQAIAHALSAILDDPELRIRFGAAGRGHSLATFSLDRLVADIDGLYRRLLEESKSPGMPPSRRSVRPAAG